jgi:putative ATP-binding cassette transporter
MRSPLQRLGSFLAPLLRRRSGLEFRKDGGVVAFRLLRDERVRAELNLTVEQGGHILRLTRQARQLRRRQFLALEKQVPHRAAATERLTRAVAMEVLAGLHKAGVLTPEQRERLRQIAWQRQGGGAFDNPLVQQALKLTPAQQKALGSIIGAMRKQLRTDAGKRPAGAIRKEALALALAVLDEEQKARWEQLKGKPFAFAEDEPAAPASAGTPRLPQPESTAEPRGLPAPLELLSFLLQTSRTVVILAVLAATLSGLGTVGVLLFVRHWLGQGRLTGAPLVLGFVGVCLVALAAQFGAQLLLLRLSRRAVARLTMRLGEQVLAAPLKSVEDLGPARVQATLTEDVQLIAGGLNAVPRLCANLAILGGCLGYLGWLSLPVLLAVLAFLAVGLLVQWLLLARARHHQGHTLDGQEVLLGQLRHLVEGVQELKVHRQRRQAFLLGSLQGSVEFQEKQGSANQFFVILSRAWARLLLFGLLGLLLIGGPLLFRVDGGTLGSYVIAVLFLWQPASSFSTLLPAVSRARQSLQRSAALGADLAAAAETSEEVEPLTAWSSLELVGVSHSYRREREEGGFTLGPLDLAFRPGELVYLGGGNGSGKTTFVKLLTGLYEPQTGEVRLDGRPIAAANLESYRQLFSVVFADCHLFPDLLGLSSPELEKKAQDYLVRLQLDHKVKIKGGAFSTVQLSRGQRKRLALLVAYLEDRPFYVFDEWAADQDPHFKDVFYTILLPKLKARGKAVLVVTHDDRYYHLADRLLFLEDGKLRSPASSNCGVPSAASSGSPERGNGTEAKAEGAASVLPGGPAATAAWLTNPRPNPGAELRLFCFPYAGRGASAFHRWSAGLPASVEVRPVQLPGREGRLSEPAFTRLAPLAEALADALRPYLDRPFVFFGHSMGALVGFEVARQLRRRGDPAPAGLLVSGRHAPQVPSHAGPLRHLPDEEFVASLAARGGLLPDLREQRELLSLVLPALRADLAACETYAYLAESPLDCPVTAYGGWEDAQASPEGLRAWAEQTTARFGLRLFPGGHFFLHSAEALLLQALARDLRQFQGG